MFLCVSASLREILDVFLKRAEKERIPAESQRKTHRKKHTHTEKERKRERKKERIPAESQSRRVAESQRKTQREKHTQRERERERERNGSCRDSKGQACISTRTTTIFNISKSFCGRPFGLGVSFLKEAMATALAFDGRERDIQHRPTTQMAAFPARNPFQPD